MYSPGASYRGEDRVYNASGHLSPQSAQTVVNLPGREQTNAENAEDEKAMTQAISNSPGIGETHTAPAGAEVDVCG